MEQEAVSVQAIYFGRIGSEATERLLARFGRDGTFLLRDSESMRGAYCLCVRKSPFVHTYRLIHCNHGWCLQTSSDTQQTFRTLETLIDNCRRGSSPGIITVPLTDPLDRAVLQQHSIADQEGLAYMEMSSSSSNSNSSSSNSSSSNSSSSNSSSSNSNSSLC